MWFYSWQPRSSTRGSSEAKWSWHSWLMLWLKLLHFYVMKYLFFFVIEFPEHACLGLWVLEKKWEDMGRWDIMGYRRVSLGEVYTCWIFFGQWNVNIGISVLALEYLFKQSWKLNKKFLKQLQQFFLQFLQFFHENETVRILFSRLWNFSRFIFAYFCQVRNLRHLAELLDNSQETRQYMAKCKYIKHLDTYSRVYVWIWNMLYNRFIFANVYIYNSTRIWTASLHLPHESRRFCRRRITGSTLQARRCWYGRVPNVRLFCGGNYICMSMCFNAT